MLFLIFEIGEVGYALAADGIIEILPSVAARKIRGAAPELAGFISYRGQYLPVVDVSQLELDRPAARRMGTRIVVVEAQASKRNGLLGLILESATDTLRCEPEDFRPVAVGPRGLVQRLDLETLLPLRVRDAVLQEEAAR